MRRRDCTPSRWKGLKFDIGIHEPRVQVAKITARDGHLEPRWFDAFDHHGNLRKARTHTSAGPEEPLMQIEPTAFRKQVTDGLSPAPPNSRARR